MGADAVLPHCVLGVGPVEPGHCKQCGKTLVGRQKSWCSDDCAHFYGRHHWWTTARVIAMKRATGFTKSQLDTLEEAPHRVWWTEMVACDQCGEFGGPFEVNHVEPRVGRGYGTGCWNHQTNLQVLCHACHVAETTRQRRERPIWDAYEHGAITSDQAQHYLDVAYWWKRGLPDPSAS